MDEVKVKEECRVCLRTDNSIFTSLFVTYKNKLVHEHISSFADVSITTGDCLPDKICEYCLSNLDTCLNFRHVCESSARQLYVRTKQLPSPDIKQEKPDDIEFAYSPRDSPSSEVDVKIKPDPEPVIENVFVTPKIVKDSFVKCHDCGKRFQTKLRLQFHWIKVHKSASKYVCPNCKTTFKTVWAINKHNSEKAHPPCTMFVAGIKDFRNDIHIEGEGRSRIFHCSHCNYNSKTLTHVKAHLATHSGIRSFKCDICEKAYTQLSTLISHKDSVHKVHFYECNICKKAYNGKRRLNMHIKKTHGLEMVQCEVCHQQLKGNRNLQIHMLRHTGIKSCTCEQCGECFYTLARLTSHKRKKHFVTKADKYIKVKKFQCDLCQYCSTTKYLLSKHMKYHISGEKPYSCQVCGFLFRTPERLATHEQTHYDNNKFPCPLCDKIFNYRRSCSKHVLIKHNMRMHQMRFPKKLTKKQKIKLLELDCK